MNKQRPYGKGLVLTADSISPDWNRINVAFEVKQQDHLGKAALVLECHDPNDKISYNPYPVKTKIDTIGVWDFVTFTLPIDSMLRTTQLIKLYVYNSSESVVQVRNFDISFRPAYLKPRVKAQSYR